MEIISNIYDNRQESGISKFNKMLYRQSLKNKYGTHAEKSMVFKILNRLTVYHS